MATRSANQISNYAKKMQAKLAKTTSLEEAIHQDLQLISQCKHIESLLRSVDAIVTQCSKQPDKHYIANNLTEILN